ncbi:DUF2809 domain-containing protein [Flavobacterium gelatinilyticum]|uniref:ribosomal maturation YjgA family protein n=1 Tax=Flavobacterium gelatinilyticum TaxID=3003260 RepID=UPI0024814311|nr:DUF2809 domain-containing protein [Flavobacterium gelatinilyticum]
MNTSRVLYSILFLSVIFLGILSRKTSLVPLWIGDSLYAIMIFLLFRIFFPHKKASHIILFSLGTCYCIEFLQLYQGAWMIELRKTLFGRYVLGQGFLWSDILAYTTGIFFIFLIEKIILKYHTYETRFRFKQ